ncbi:hypothetical protein [Pseudarthrobacter sp. H2]|uniref:hypothetical protein n=1 Tax=Pseudarthrobacter sp. H2 TaxID=3418415 RepID=UPI003CFAF198
MAIAVVFAAWSQIASCNANAKAKDEADYNVAMATSDGAIEYCKKSLRFLEGDRERFEVTGTNAVRRSSTSTAYDVTLGYKYLDGYRRAMTTSTFNCATLYMGSDRGWETARR